MAKLIVRFYEILDKNGQQFPDLDIERLLDTVAAIPNEDAYVKLAKMELLGSTHAPQGAGRAPQCPMIVLDRITREVRMRIENQREYRPLELGDGDTIAEPTHVGMFPRNVVGILRQSGQAPGPASFREFLNASDLLEEEVTVVPLADRNAVRALSNVGRLTKLNIQLDSESATNVLGPSRFLNDAFELFRHNLGRVDVEIIVKMSHKGPAETSDRLLEEIRALQESGALASTEKAEITYRRLEDGRSDSYDFLTEAVAQSVDVEVDEDRLGPSNPRASESIMDAYEKQYEDIMSALNRGGSVVPPA
ncbi:MAG: hypothetical protein J0I49_14730 [Pseudonocardia sp.]|uniref:hypothetical protein n=1 Tax=Pseudonocardia sp. TaxID=60912 RepID=UPI001AC62B48|nr:hypothetical protein [Pseudonocardia sp.]MBN9099349.1 hypothetical protein [Pseudonocardia sp.]